MARLWISVLSVAMLGLWLNVAAVFIVASSNALPGVPSPLLELVYVAYWPSWLSGAPHEAWFYPDAVTHIVTNLVGWTSLGVCIGVFFSLRAPRGQKPMTGLRNNAPSNNEMNPAKRDVLL